jgi:dipeptidyl-peptidase-4
MRIKFMRKLLPILCLLLPGAWLPAQEGPTLEDIWLRYRYVPQYAEGFDWMNDNRYYSLQEETAIARYSVEKDEKVDEILSFKGLSFPGAAGAQVESYAFSPDESQVLLLLDTEPVYRYSSLERCYVVDRASKRVLPLHGGQKISLAAFSPDGKRIAYVADNNLYCTELASGAETALTADGKPNQIINGGMDWVYEEEFALTSGFAWSPDGQRLAFFRFDESRVREFSLHRYGSLYPEEYRYKYPKAGEENSVVSIHIHDLASGRTVQADLGPETDQYVARIQWQSPRRLGILRLNRLQNHADVLLADAASGATRVMLSEDSDTYLREPSDESWRFLADGSLLWLSERSGYAHLYHYDSTGSLIRPLTEGSYEVELLDVDEASETIYFLSTESSPLERKLYSANFKGKKKICLTPEPGYHDISLSDGCQYFTDSHSSLGKLPSTRLCDREGKTVRYLTENKDLASRLEKMQLPLPELFTLPAEDGETLNGWMLRPRDFDPAKKYPVLMFVYGGPGSQEVLNQWGAGSGAFNYLWYQMLAARGYLIACVDNRGTGGRGRDFRDATYADLGKLETQDQIAAARYLGALPYVDAQRIGIWGWSYGGYMTALCMTKGNGLFKMGISVAPVTNWRFYDTIYTERYLKTPQENPAGYDQNSPLNFAKDLKGAFLLVHGTADDNVHYQNSLEMVDALVRANKQFDTFFYPNKNHGIYGGVTRYHLYRKMTDFISENL